MSTKRRGPSRKRDSKGRFLKSGAGRSKTRVKHIVVKNPGEEFILGNPPESRTRRATRAVGGFFGRTGIGAAAKAALPAVLGALAAKFSQKKFGDKGDETQPWTGKDYLAGLLGTLAVSFAARALFKTSSATSQRIMEGGFMLALFKLATQKIAPMTEITRNYLSDEPYMGASDEGSWSGADEVGGGYLAGDLFDAQDGQTYVLGSDGQWRPVDDSHRLPAAAGLDIDPYIQEEPYMGEVLLPPGRLGEDLVPPGRLGEDPYHEAYRA